MTGKMETPALPEITPVNNVPVTNETPPVPVVTPEAPVTPLEAPLEVKPDIVPPEARKETPTEDVVSDVVPK